MRGGCFPVCPWQPTLCKLVLEGNDIANAGNCKNAYFAFKRFERWMVLRRSDVDQHLVEVQEGLSISDEEKSSLYFQSIAGGLFIVDTRGFPNTPICRQ